MASIVDQTPFNIHTGNGVSVTFGYTFQIFDDDDLAVSIDGVLITSGLTVNGVGNQAGGDVTFTSPPASGAVVLLLRSTKLRRDVDYSVNSDLPSETLDFDVNRVWTAIQDAFARTNRAPLVPVGETIGAIPSLSARASKFLAFDASGNPFASDGTGTDTGLRGDLASSSGSSLVSQKIGLAGAVQRSIAERIADMPTVEEWGAKGDGVANDAAAFQAMATATGGLVVLGPKTYYVPDLQFLGYDHLAIIGAGRPVLADGNGSLLNGSVLVGSVYCRANAVYFADFGVDSGASRAVANRGGLWADAAVGLQGRSALVRNVAVLNQSDAGTWHGVALQGYSQNVVHGVLAARQQFGVVIKGQRSHVSDIDLIECRTAGVYIKADAGALAANVANAKCIAGTVVNVTSQPLNTNTDCSAVYLHASSDEISQIAVRNVQQSYGYAGVRLHGGGLATDPALSAPNISGVIVDRAQYGVACDGYVHDPVIDGVQAINPATGRAVILTANVDNWNIANLAVTITDAAIASDVCAEFYGTGAWTNVTARNAFRTMKVQVQAAQLGQIACGQVGYGVKNSNDAALAGINGAAVDATDPPSLKIKPGSAIVLSGKFDLTASANKYFCNLPITTGKQKVVAAGGIDSTGAYVSVAVRLNDFQLSIEPTLPAGFKKIDLSTIQIQMM